MTALLRAQMQVACRINEFALEIGGYPTRSPPGGKNNNKSNESNQINTKINHKTYKDTGTT
eukprot:4912870-Ditylum_brightwellii.AAC.1